MSLEHPAARYSFKRGEGGCPATRQGTEKIRADSMRDKSQCNIGPNLRPQKIGQLMTVSLWNPIFQTLCQTTHQTSIRPRRSPELSMILGDQRRRQEVKHTLLNGCKSYPMALYPSAQTTSEHGPTPTEQTTKQWKGAACLNATGQFKAPSVTSEETAHTAEVLQQMSYIGGMNYARARLQEATASRLSGKSKQVRPPALLAQTGTTGPHRDSRSSSPSSKAA